MQSWVCYEFGECVGYNRLRPELFSAVPAGLVTFRILPADVLGRQLSLQDWIPSDPYISQRSRQAPTVKPAPTEASKHQAFALQPMIVERRLHGQGNGGGGGVSEAVDIDDHPFQRQPQALRGRKNDALVRLVRDEAAQVTGADVVGLQQLGSMSPPSCARRTCKPPGRPGGRSAVGPRWSRGKQGRDCLRPACSAPPPRNRQSHDKSRSARSRPLRVGSTRTAPAPSPKMTQVARSV